VAGKLLANSEKVSVAKVYQEVAKVYQEKDAGKKRMRAYCGRFSSGNRGLSQARIASGQCIFDSL